MDYPLSKYKFYQHTLPDGSIEIIAISTYAGKEIKGRAKCHPNDTFNAEKGRMLAALRCNAKIAEKRNMRALKKCDEAAAQLEAARKHYDAMIDYYTNSFRKSCDAINECVEYYNNEIKS